jgi:hypothetical protein
VALVVLVLVTAVAKVKAPMAEMVRLSPPLFCKIKGVDKGPGELASPVTVPPIV